MSKQSDVFVAAFVLAMGLHVSGWPIWFLWIVSCLCLAIDALEMYKQHLQKKLERLKKGIVHE